MSGDVGGAAVERQFPPPLAEGGHAAIVVLQSHQPFQTILHFGRNISLLPAAIFRQQVMQRHQCPTGVVSIRHRAAEVAPAPTAWGCMGEGMDGCRGMREDER